MTRDKRQTIIDGQPVWFLVCAENEMKAAYVGPFLSLEDAQSELGNSECTYAHFTASWVPEWAFISVGSVWNHYENGASEKYCWAKSCPVVDYIIDHNERAEEHPMHRGQRSLKGRELEAHWEGLLQ